MLHHRLYIRLGTPALKWHMLGIFESKWSHVLTSVGKKSRFSKIQSYIHPCIGYNRVLGKNMESTGSWLAKGIIWWCHLTDIMLRQKQISVCRSKAWNLHQIRLTYIHAQDTTQSSISSCLVLAAVEISSLSRKLIFIFPFRQRSPSFSPDTTLITFKPTCPCTLNHGPLQKTHCLL